MRSKSNPTQISLITYYRSVLEDHLHMLNISLCSFCYQGTVCVVSPKFGHDFPGLSSHRDAHVYVRLSPLNTCVKDHSQTLSSDEILQ